MVARAGGAGPRGAHRRAVRSPRARITIDQALSDVAAALPNANPNNDFRAALRRLHPTAGQGSS
jgi:hypothetical protein